VVDLCAGQGWMSFWLTKYGFPVLAIDDQSWKWDKEQFLSMVIKEDAVTYAKDHSEVDLFILSWPFMDNTAISIWKSMRKGQYLLYIGESEGGCTANDDFFHKTYDNEVTSPIENNFVAFFGIHDRPILFRK